MIVFNIFKIYNFCLKVKKKLWGNRGKRREPGSDRVVILFINSIEPKICSFWLLKGTFWVEKSGCKGRHA
jgi:hypothetical protein